MIDFDNSTYSKMKDDSSYAEKIQELLLSGEDVLNSSKSQKVGVVFTSTRVFIVNTMGMRGKKIDATCFPYKSVNHYSVETLGSFDKDTVLTIVGKHFGKVVFELNSGSNILEISRAISQAIL